MEVKCENCKYWAKNQKVDLGECLRYPPVFHEGLYKIQKDKGVPTLQAMWVASLVPTTKDSTRCGEWKAR